MATKHPKIPQALATVSPNSSKADCQDLSVSARTTARRRFTATTAREADASTRHLHRHPDRLPPADACCRLLRQLQYDSRTRARQQQHSTETGPLQDFCYPPSSFSVAHASHAARSPPAALVCLFVPWPNNKDQIATSLLVDLNWSTNTMAYLYMPEWENACGKPLSLQIEL